jgi:hypothetical protein
VLAAQHLAMEKARNVLDVRALHTWNANACESLICCVTVTTESLGDVAFYVFVHDRWIGLRSDKWDCCKILTTLWNVEILVRVQIDSVIVMSVEAALLQEVTQTPIILDQIQRVLWLAMPTRE